MKQRRSYEMPPKKATEEVLPELIEEVESPIEKLENRIAVLESMVAKLYGQHYGGFRQ
jgi:hypothetical protein